MSKYKYFSDFFDVISQDESLLRLLFYKPINLLDDPLSPSKPNIIGSEEHKIVIERNVLRAPKSTDLPPIAICRICMYLGYNTAIKNRQASIKVFDQEIVFDVYSHIDEFEVIDNRSLKICDRLNELLHDERISGIGKADGYKTIPILNAPDGYIGYRMIFSFGSTKWKT